MTFLRTINNNFFDDVQKVFNDEFFKTPYYAYRPNADMVETENGYELSFDVPGFNQDNLSVKVENGVLTVDGATKEEQKEGDEKKYILKERNSREFHRAFKLPQSIDKEQIKANLKDGVLRISLEKQPEEKPKQISIN